MKKYNFVEFVAACESKNFDIIEDSWLEWAKQFLKGYESIWVEVHSGDCTKSSHTCSLCLLQTLLADFKEYTFNETAWREANGI